MELPYSLLLAKIEGTYGEENAPSESTDVITVHGDIKFEMVTKAAERNIPMAHMGQLAPLIIGEAYKVSGLKIPIKTSGAAGTAPVIGRLLRAAGCTEVISAGASATYTPHSSLLTESLTVHCWVGVTQHKLIGCIVSSFKLPLVAGERMEADVELIGLYGGAIADSTYPTPVHTGTEAVWNAANFKFNAIETLVISKLDIDLGIEHAMRKDANAATGINRYYVKNRIPKVSFDPEKVALSTLNPFTLHTAQTACDLETKPTATAGNKIEILINDITLDAPAYGDRENVRTWELNGTARPAIATGNTEFSIAFK